MPFDIALAPLAETAFASFVAFLVILDPPGAAVVFVALTRGHSSTRRRQAAWSASLLAGAILVLFALAGEMWLAALGIDLSAFRIAGGVLLFLLATQMVFGRFSGNEIAETSDHDGISVFPLAFPLIAGPGAMTSAILLMDRAGGDPILGSVVIAALIAALAVILLSMLRAELLVRLLKVTGCSVVARVMAINLAALAVQFIVDGGHAVLTQWHVLP